VWQTSNITFSTNGFTVRNLAATRDYISINNTTGILKLGFGAGTNHGFKLETTGVGVTVLGHTETQTLNVSGVVTATKYLGDAQENFFVGVNAGSSNTLAACNIAIGHKICLPSAVADKQLAVGINTGRWISGNPSFNVGVGTDVGVGTTARARLYVEGSVHASRFYQNPTQLLSNTTFPEEGGTANGGVFGPYTLATGVTLTISSGSTFTIL